MQMFHLESGSQLKVGDEIMPVQLQKIPVGDSNLIERDVEDLVVQYPQLLNYGRCDIGSEDTADLLIVSRQTKGTTNKRLDLLALDIEGRLVVVEVKRDAKDAEARREALEFQAIRYAASCAKLTVDRIEGLFAKYLWKKEHQNDASYTAAAYTADEEAKYRTQAIKKICQHLSDEDDVVTEADLPEIIKPSEDLRIYLVAGDYDEDVTSACAWLRDNKVDISCFRLRPYLIAKAYVLQRERLIPPPELGDFLVDIKDQGSTNALRKANGGRARSIRPVRILWGPEDHKEISECNSWKALLEKCVSKALEAGLPIEKLPMHKRTTDGRIGDLSPDNDHTIFLEKYQLYIDCYAGRLQIEAWIRNMRESLGKPRGFISVELADGETTQP